MAFGAQGESVRKDINPALLYFQALQVAPELTSSDRDYLFASEWRVQKLPPRFGELASRYNNQFELVRQAAQATAPCDWGIDWSRGPATLLPHLGRNKVIAQTARLRAAWFLQNGKPMDATQDILAALALARNSSSDGSLIAMLVQIAAENLLCSTVAENYHRFSSEALQQLSEGFAATAGRRTIASCIAIEMLSLPDWLMNKVLAVQKEHPGDEAQVLAEIQKTFVMMGSGGDEGSNDQTLWPRVLSAAGGSSDGILRLLRDAKPLYPKLAAVLALPLAEYETQMKQFSAEVRASKNPIVTEFFPAWEKCRPREFGALTTLAMVQAAAQYKLKGEAGLKTIMDPCGHGPFALERFTFEGEDRGFLLKGAYTGRGFQEIMIFVEKDGAPFQVYGKNAGQASPKPRPAQ